MSTALTTALTIEDVQTRLPRHKKLITQECVDIINQSLNEPEFQEETLLQTASIYEGILKSNRGVTISSYLNAVRFCAYLMANEKSNYTEAYKKVFAHRDFVKERMFLPGGSKEYGELSSAASRYRKSKIVVDILTASQIPLDLMFTGYRYKAIGVLATIMDTAKYDRDKINAAKELLAATKGPENMKIQLDIGVKENSAVQQLNDQLAEIAGRSLKHLEAGSTNLKELGSMKVKDDNIIEGEAIRE